MYSTCGKKGFFGNELPCASNSPAQATDAALKASLADVCGVEWDSACCTSSQLETLQSSLQQAEPLIALCPACRLNFRSFYCSLTCSPDQSLFVSVTATQNISKDYGPAVKSLAYHVDESFGQGFFDACKNVKFGATNGYAMDLIGGGAKDWQSFLRYMGQEVSSFANPHFVADELSATWPGIAFPN
jgi:Niemann-Pick C1 protein